VVAIPVAVIDTGKLTPYLFPIVMTNGVGRDMVGTPAALG